MAHATAKTDHPSPSLFISYASEDREVARRLRDTLSAQGIDVWYDEDELTGGDAWDKKIRDRIRACDYFMPLISNATEARREGYFRREWRQAAERTLDMSDDVMFLLPVNIDNVSEYGARVPERFTQVQWTRCPAGESNPDLAALCDRMLRRDDAAPVVTSTPPVPPVGKKHDRKSLPPYPPQPIRTSDEPAWLHAFNSRCLGRALRISRLSRVSAPVTLGCHFLVHRGGHEKLRSDQGPEGHPRISGHQSGFPRIPPNSRRYG